MDSIVVEHLSVARGGRRPPILDDLNLSVPEGASLGLIGPNGSGKSTLLRVLVGLIRPTAGRVVVGGVDVSQDAVKVRRRVGYVPEQFGLYPRLSIHQHLEFYAHASGVSQWERRNAIDTMLRVVDLFDVRHTEAAALSRGARRRLALARALLNNPPVLLLDDPLAGLDGRGRLEVVEILKEIRGMGVTMVVATHLLADLVQVCDSVAVLRDGRITWMAPFGEALVQPGIGRQRLRVELVEQSEVVTATLTRQAGVLDVVEEGAVLSFSFEGDRDALARLLDVLHGSGAKILQFGPSFDQLDSTIAALVTDRGQTGVGAS
jgi:ABC-2 type transport system ATP-binding protein